MTKPEAENSQLSATHSAQQPLSKTKQSRAQQTPPFAPTTSPATIVLPYTEELRTNVVSPFDYAFVSTCSIAAEEKEEQKEEKVKE